MARKSKMTDAEFAVWFAAMLDKSGGPDACWPWMGARLKAGYGTVGWKGGRTHVTHRVAFLISGGVLTDEKPLVLHGESCAVSKGGVGPACCNPAHLSAGDHSDNQGRDRRRDGTIPTGARHGSVTHPERFARGERQGGAKLTDASIPLIFAAKAAGESKNSISRRFGVCRGTIAFVLAGKTWRHVSCSP